MRKCLSRREFVSLAAIAPFARTGFLQTRGPLTAQQVVDQIKQKFGGEWKADGVDTFKAGDPLTPVKGIATSTMATMDVLKQAVKTGANFIITSEPTFYARSDAPAPAGARRGASPAAPDPIYTAKNDFIMKNQLVVWRFSDHWRQR